MTLALFSRKQGKENNVALTLQMATQSVSQEGGKWGNKDIFQQEGNERHNLSFHLQVTYKTNVTFSPKAQVTPG